ncbi:autotransporter outer membrane beta-barrel domain-containing protein, partial [Agrobacterium sp. S2]|nr:autotransporter outer membrane beta-barrel domain-containing protein [Agrobacterium sp. S2]
GHRSGDPRGIYDGAPEFDYRFAAFQAGLDLYSNEANGLTDRAGLYLAYGHGIMDVTQDRIFEERSAGRNQFDAVTLGGYWTRLADDGWYLDGVLPIGFPEQDADGVGLAASLEAGRAFHLADGWQIEPQAQLVLQTIRMG